MSKLNYVMSMSLKEWSLYDPFEVAEVLKEEARRKVSTAVLSGKLKRGLCVVCRSERTVGHHTDYTKQLDVIWVCYKHHSLWHGQGNILSRKRKQNFGHYGKRPTYLPVHNLWKTSEQTVFK